VSDAAADVARINWEAAKRGLLSMWTIYERPTDHPDGYIARRFESIMPTDDTLTGELGALREIFMEAGLFKLPRSAEDEPQIVETWL
jgi:hypothetical protein